MPTIDPEWPNDEKILDLGGDDLAVRLYFACIASPEMASDGTSRPVTPRRARARWLMEAGKTLEEVGKSWTHLFDVELLVGYTEEGHFFSPGYLHHTGRLDRAVRAAKNPEIPHEILERFKKFAEKYHTLRPGRKASDYKARWNKSQPIENKGVEIPGISGTLQEIPGNSGTIRDHPGPSPSCTGTGSGTALNKVRTSPLKPPQGEAPKARKKRQKNIGITDEERAEAQKLAEAWNAASRPDDLKSGYWAWKSVRIPMAETVALAIVQALRRPGFTADWPEALETCKYAGFLRGNKNETGWIARLEWFCRPGRPNEQSMLAQILQGKHNDEDAKRYQEMTYEQTLTL